VAQYLQTRGNLERQFDRIGEEMGAKEQELRQARAKQLQALETRLSRLDVARKREAEAAVRSGALQRAGTTAIRYSAEGRRQQAELEGALAARSGRQVERILNDSGGGRMMSVQRRQRMRAALARVPGKVLDEIVQDLDGGLPWSQVLAERLRNAEMDVA